MTASRAHRSAVGDPSVEAPRAVGEARPTLTGAPSWVVVCRGADIGTHGIPDRVRRELARSLAAPTGTRAPALAATVTAAANHLLAGGRARQVRFSGTTRALLVEVLSPARPAVPGAQHAFTAAFGGWTSGEYRTVGEVQREHVRWAQHHVPSGSAGPAQRQEAEADDVW